MDADEPSAAEPQPQRYGVRGLVRAFGRRVVAVECGTVSKSPGPLDASLLWRQVAKAAKAVTSHRTPSSCPGPAVFSTGGNGGNRDFSPSLFSPFAPVQTGSSSF